MRVMFYIVSFILILCFTSNFINSTNTVRKENRYIDLLVGVCQFVMFLFLVKIFN